MLSDPDSSIIRRFGVFNEQVAPDSRDYGIPHPGIFLVDARGIVRERFFEEQYWNRMTTPAVFWRLGLDLSAASGGGEREHLRIRTAVSDEIVSPGNRFTLFVDIDPLPGVHVYAPDVGGGYQGLALSVDPPAHVLAHEPIYPPAARLRLPWTGEALTGYARPVRVSVDISLGTRIDLAPVIEAGRGLRIPGTLRLQACDNRVCWAPETIALSWHVGLRPPDLERVPEPLQHKAKGS
jgi:DsbC/DsbD-like thiol-disulfide interchange protein